MQDGHLQLGGCRRGSHMRGVLWRLGIGQIWPVQRGGMAGRSLSSDREADELEHFGEQQYRGQGQAQGTKKQQKQSEYMRGAAKTE